jgi:Tfp pilus assembly protein PilX
MMVPIATDGEMLPVRTGKGALANEQGMVLIIVLVMLLLFSILGATVLTNSTSELSVAGNYRNLEQAFFASNGGYEQGQISNAIFSLLQNPGDVWSGTITFTPAGVVAITQNATVTPGTANAAQAVVTYVGSGPPPKGSGFDDTWQANIYDLDVTGYGPNNTEIEINANIARMQAKSSNY